MIRGNMVNRRYLLSLIACLALLMSSGAQAYAQDTEAQPTSDPAGLPNDPTAPQNEGTPEPVGTAAATQSPTRNTGSRNSAQRAENAASPGSPAVLAHGLAYQSGDDVVWQVREIDVPVVDDAQSDVTSEAIVLQRDGSSIIRNDATGKRALVDTGEAYFRTADDSYLLASEDNGSIVWQFELVDPDDVAGDAFYESPVIDDLDEASYDMLLTRYVLQPGDEADLPENNGAGMIMVSSGETQVDMDGDLSALEEGDGQLIQQSVKISNEGDLPSVVVYVYLGDTVGETTAGEAQGSSQSDNDVADASGSPTAGAQDGTLQDESDVNQDTQDAAPTQTAEDGTYVTSINITADTDIYLIITVDGLTVFDGNLPAGSSSGPVVGSSFEIYTSSGVSTNFTNACGEYFKMGYEEGEVTYTLNATAESCKP